MSTRFFTNKESNTLLKKFEGIFEHNPDLERFDALVGYLRASGYFAIRPFLENVPTVRILVGINVDNIVEEFHKKGHLFLADVGKTLAEFRKLLAADIQEARYAQEVETGILQFVEDVVAKKVEIRAHPTKKLHAKIYIFHPVGFNEHKPGHVITGSSNLTASGLGAQRDEQTYEFNVLSHDYDDVKFAADEFDALWAEAVHILPKEIQAITQKSFLRNDLTPFEVYIKLLIEYFGPAIEYNPNSESDLPEGFMKLAYQQDAVTQGFLMLEKHNGFFLADVVGLGKTIIAILIAKKFFYHNGFPNHLSHTLIIVPPAVKHAWQETVEKFKLSNVDIQTNGSLHKIRTPKKYDLVIVDEAHKFRNDTAAAYDELQRICKTRTNRRYTDGAYARKRVILVSATPLNNSPSDLRNLLLLFQDGKDSTIDAVPNIQRFFANREKEFQAAKKLPMPDSGLEVSRISGHIRTKVLSEITIRRTRTDLTETPEYKKNLDEMGIVFPAVDPPKKLLYPLSPALEALYDQTLAVLDHELSYNRYRAIGHLVPEKKLKYEKADLISANLAKIMRTLLLKRLDSSFHAFTRSLHRFRDANRAMVTMFEQGKIIIAPELDVSEYILAGREEELLDLAISLQETDPTIEICTPEHFVPAFLPGLEKDQAFLDDLADRWSKVTEDPKFDIFLQHLESEILDPAINHEAKKGNPKAVIFSESAETTAYLVKKLGEHGHDKILSISAATRKHLMDDVRANFDANQPIELQRDDYTLIVSTEVLAEGVNLHRANVVVNYDTPWNSTRLMQRIGRVNRIGGSAPRIHIYNFFPTAKVDADIDFRRRAIAKLQAFHSALGEDSQIYSTEEEIDHFGLFDRTLEEEKDESLTLLTELRAYRRNNPERFREIRNLPMRARCARKDRHRDGATIVFVRNRHRDGFYYLSPDAEEDTPVEELSFVEAARIFHAHPPERPLLPLPDHHHPDVNAALDHYRESLHREAVHDQIVDHQIGPAEKAAKQLLSTLLAVSHLTSASEKILLERAQDAISRAAFQKLQKELNKLWKTQKKTPVSGAILLDKAMAIIAPYNFSDDEDEALANPRAGLTAADLEPSIVLSESFSVPPKT